jgi:hypothetical protein
MRLLLLLLLTGCGLIDKRDLTEQVMAVMNRHQLSPMGIYCESFDNGSAGRCTWPLSKTDLDQMVSALGLLPESDPLVGDEICRQLPDFADPAGLVIFADDLNRAYEDPRLGVPNQVQFNRWVVYYQAASGQACLHVTAAYG